MSIYEYRSLTPHQRRIRLACVLPSKPHSLRSSATNDSCYNQPNALVACSILHVSLDKAPPYMALSYNWGDATRTNPILVDGALFAATMNLEAALRRLQSPDCSVNIWIDALCIDQNDNAEKCEQLEQMREIYTRAVSVIAWLGPSANNSDLAMKWIQEFGSRSYELGVGTKPQKQLQCILETLDGDEPGNLDKDLVDFAQDLRRELLPEDLEHGQVRFALRELFRRPYWRRIWVVQELASASKLFFMCGKSTVTEKPLDHALRLIRNLRLYQLKWDHRTSNIPLDIASVVSIETTHPINLLKSRKAVELSPLIHLMRSFRYFQATDPRDKIFALLGIAGDTEALELHPDYNKPCELVYTEVARKLIHHGYLEVMSMCRFPKNISSLPSWVPDWSLESRHSPLQQRSVNRSIRPFTTILEPKYSASGTNFFPNKAIQHGSQSGTNVPISLPGVVLGEIQVIGVSWEPVDVGRWLHDLHQLSELIADSFDASGGREQAVWRTAVADQEIRQGARKPRLSEDMIRKIEATFKDVNLNLADSEMLIGAGFGDYCLQLSDTAHRRRPFIVSGRFLGIGPRETVPGDIIYIPLEADVPLVLRRSIQTGEMQLIGEAYVHGVMDGEAMGNNPDIETINIS